MKITLMLLIMYNLLFASNEYKYNDNVECSFVYYKKEKKPEKYNALLYGMKTAAKEINRNGGFGGHKLDIVDYNEKGKVETTIEIAKTISNKDNVIGVIGFSNSQRASKSINIVTNKNIPIISSAGSDKLFDIDKKGTFFTTNFGIKGELKYLQKFIKAKAYKKIYFITFKNDNYGLEYYKSVKEILPSKLLTINKSFNKAAFKDALLSIDKNTLIIISTNVQDNAKISKILRDSGNDNDIFFAKGGIVGKEFYDAGGNNLKNIYELSTLLAGASNDTLLKFQNDNKKYFEKGTNKSYLEYAAYGYDTIYILKNAYDRSNVYLEDKSVLKIREHIVNGLKKINTQNPYDGISESYSFNKKRQGGILTPQYILKSTGKKASLYKKQYIFKNSKLVYVPTLYTNIDIKNITIIDQEASTYSIDFMLTLISEQNIVLDDLEFENIQINSSYTPSIYAREFLIENKHTDNEMYVKTYNVKATFEYGNTIENFPFDTQSLPIYIKPKNPIEHNFITYFVTDFQNIINNASIGGWEVKNSYAGFKKGVYKFIDSDFKQNKNYYYRSSMTIDVSRLAISSAIKFILPLMIVLLITIVLFLLPDRAAADKVGSASNMLITVAALYFTYATLVEVDYITFVDKLYMGSLVFVLITNVIFILRQRYYNELPENLIISDPVISVNKNKKDFTKHYRKYSWIFYNSTLIISVILFIIAISYFINKAQF